MPGDYSQSQEFKAAITTAKLFKSAIAKIAFLPGPDKGVDDFCVTGGDIEAVISTAASVEAIEKQIQASHLSHIHTPFSDNYNDSLDSSGTPVYIGPPLGNPNLFGHDLFINLNGEPHGHNYNGPQIDGIHRPHLLSQLYLSL